MSLPMERRFEALVSSVRDYAIFMLDLSGCVQTWNLGAQLIKGYTPDEIIGRHFSTFYTPADREAGAPEKLLAHARQDGRVEDIGWRLRKDGTRFYADVVITALRDDHGNLLGYGKVTRDLTEKRREEERRIEQETRFRTIIDSIHDYAVFMLDAEGRVATWNTGAARIKGYSPDEIIGTHFSIFYPEERRFTGHPERELQTALRDGRFEEEGWRVRKDGTEFWANVVLTPLYAADGRHIGFVKITRDLTERRTAELERERLVQAQEAVRLRDEFLSIASHELRTPLMALQLQLESLHKVVAGADSKLESKVERAERGAHRLAELVEALFDVTRIVSGHLTLHAETADLAGIVTDVAERMQETAARSGCKLSVHADSGIIGNWDSLRMGQVVTNLLSNAIKYASASDIDVTLRRAGDRVTLLVVDHGPGIAREDHDRIFGRFERAADSRHYGGLGLGLYVAKQIVAAHGGTIRAHDTEGGGATFTIDLPREGMAA